MIKDLSTKNAVLNKDLREMKEVNERYYTKNVILEGELNIVNNKYKQTEIGY